MAADARVRQALRTGRLRHVFQPIWDLRSGGLVGFEALARFPGGCSPAEAWAAARASGTWLELDQLSVRSAVRQGARLPGLLFINVSGRYLEADPASIEAVLAAVHAWQSVAGRVVLEVTEDAIGSLAQAAEGVARLRGLGIRIALDDAGSGQATPERLALLTPGLGFLKLDRSLVSAWLAGDRDRLAQWVAWARARRVYVVAEGVEDPAAAEPLRRAGVRGVQGFAFGAPAGAAVWNPERLRSAAPARPGRPAPDRPGSRPPGVPLSGLRRVRRPRAVPGRPSPLPPLHAIHARWRPLYRDDAWMAAVQDLQRHLRRLTGADRCGLWACLPPHGHWMYLASETPGSSGTCLEPDEPPLDRVRRERKPLAYPSVPAGPAFRRALEGLGLAACRLIPLALPRASLGEPELVGVLALGRTSGSAAPEGDVADLVPVVAHFLAQRVQETYIEAAMEWIASQPSPSGAAEWVPLLAELAGWFGGDHWALFGVARVPGAPAQWECVAENGHFAGTGAAWAQYATRFADALSVAPGVRSARQGRIDFLGDMWDQPGASPELRAWQQRLVAAGLRSVLTLPLGEGSDGRLGVLVIYWRQPSGWRQAGPSARPWEALRRLLAGWWREMASAAHLLRDPLTGVLNRRGIARVWSGSPWGAGVLGMLDCDGFHDINNVWGHLVGDDMLRGLGGALAEETDRRGGWCGRWGGDEFVVGLPAAVDWHRFGRRLQQRLDELARERGWPQRMTLSGGAARWQAPRPAWEAVLEAADQALSAAKRAGGGRFTVLSPRPAGSGRPGLAL